MDTTISEIAQIEYLGILMALVQLYLELNLPVTDAILAAETDLVTWKTVTPVSRPVGLPLDQWLNGYGRSALLPARSAERSGFRSVQS
jgi:hypothetical protein